MHYVIGASIAGLILAERLHKRGVPVTLIAGGPPEPKRLSDGCSLRKSTLDAFSSTFPDFDFWTALGGADGQGVFTGTGIEGVSAEGTLVAPKMANTIGSAAALSTRHGHILSVLRSRLTAPVIEGFVKEIRGNEIVLEGRTLAITGLVLNTLPRPVLGTPKTPKRYVLAAQVPVRGTLEAIGYAPMLDRHLGFITPFFDPATPEATHYVINTTVTTNPTPELRAEVERVLSLMVKAYGMTPIEPEATLASAVVPVVETFVPVPSSDPRIVNLYDAFSPGAPAVNVDGMLSQAWGAVAFADHLDAGVEAALTRVSKYLKEIRFWNRNNTTLFFDASLFSRRAQLFLWKPLMPYLLKKWVNLGSVPA
jgi:hypothetical protein